MGVKGGNVALIRIRSEGKIHSIRKKKDGSSEVTTKSKTVKNKKKKSKIGDAIKRKPGLGFARSGPSANNNKTIHTCKSVIEQPREKENAKVEGGGRVPGQRR